MVYYLAKDGIKTDLLTRCQVLERIEGGDADSETLAWVQGMAGWKPLGEFTEFEGAFDGPTAEDAAAVKKHLEGAEGRVRKEKVEGKVKPVAAREAGGKTGERPRPWMRLFARGVDLILLVVVFQMGFLLLFPGQKSVVVESISAQVMVHAAMILAWCFVEALCLSRIGFTPGKALFRVMVRDGDGGLLTYKVAFRRTVLVWIKGLALMIVYVTPIAMMIAHARLMVFGTTTWDRDLNVRVTHGRPNQVQIGVVVVIYAVFGYLIYQQVLAQLEKAPKEENREGEGRPGGSDEGREGTLEHPGDVV